MIAYALLPVPDILITGDGHHVAITGLVPELVTLDTGEGQGRFAQDALSEAVGTAGATRALETMPGTRCGHDFCAIALDRARERAVLLIARSRRRLDETALARACAQSDIVIAARALPAACAPRRLRIDQAVLDAQGGMTIDLARGRIDSVRSVANLPSLWH